MEMKQAEIHHLINQALQGDQAALNKLGVWATRAAIRQGLAANNLGAGERALIFAEREELERFRDAIARTHKTRTENIMAGLEKAYQDHQSYLESFLLRERTRELRQKLEHHFERCVEYHGLYRVPIRRLIKETVYRLASEREKG